MNTPISPEFIQAALKYVPAEDRDLWVRLGMATKAELGEKGFDVWDSWSQTAESYRERDARSVWRSLKADGRVTVGTLLYEAKSRGFKLNGEGARINHAEIERHKRERAAAIAKQTEERARLQEQAAQQAAEIWRVCQEAREHPYLSRKGIQPHGVRIYKGGFTVSGMRCDGALVIPIRNAAGDIRSLQFIQEGEKRYLANAEKSGCYFSIGKPEGVICIAEGFATASSIHESTGRAVAVAFDSGNLLSVAHALKEKFPDAELILCADDDIRTAGNPGLTKATEAAQSVGGLVAVPDFGTDRPAGATDFNDLHQAQGLEAVERAIENAAAPAMDEHLPDAGNAAGGTPAGHIAYRRASEIQAKPIWWLWKGRIARGKVSMLAGNPGLGKSQVTVSLAAVVSTGGAWPVDRTRCERGNVIFLSAEDDPEDTIRPRLEAAGADLSRVFILGAVVECFRADGGEVVRAFNLKTDIGRLGALLGKIGDVALIVIDPITAYLGEANSHVNAEIRALLSPLSDIAAKHGAAVVCVSHLNKNGGAETLMRVTGSLAFVAAARSAWLVAKDPENEARRLFLPLKNNNGKDQKGLAFAVQSEQLESPAGLIETSHISWEAEAVTVTADEVMALQGDPDERSAVEDAKQFLAGLLADGPVNAGQIKKDADGAGFNWRTVQRAADRLGVERHKEGMRGGWLWSLAPKMTRNTEDDTHRTVSPSGSVVAFDGKFESVEVVV